jgi:hypothetical protein
MQLLIRSQDRMTLCKCNNIYIDDEFFSPYYIKDDTLTLGKYSTKERALEVLDEIQEAQLGNYHYRCPSNVKVSNNDDTIVYEMPKD